jgi:hypothetical protein
VVRYNGGADHFMGTLHFIAPLARGVDEKKGRSLYLCIPSPLCGI